MEGPEDPPEPFLEEASTQTRNGNLKMARAYKFLRPITQSLPVITSSCSPLSHSRKSFSAEFQPLKKLIKGIELAFRSRASTVHRGLIAENKYSRFSGSVLTFGSIFCVSAVIGSKSTWPHVAYSFEGRENLLEDCEFLDASDEEDDTKALWMLARKLWLPVCLFLTVLTNWDHPLALIAIKIAILLLSTNPSPLSVYVFVDRLCHQSMRQEPHLYRVKPLYAKRVEVQDYKLFCVASVELKEEKFTLVGILGGWWPLPTRFGQGAFSIGSGALKH